MKKKVSKPAKKAVSKGKKAVAKTKALAVVKVSSRILGQAPVENEFVLQDGRKLKTVMELVDALETMNDDLFKFHANPEKNDFSNWLRDVFDERAFAEDLKKMQDRVAAQREIMKRIVEVAKSEGKKLR